MAERKLYEFGRFRLDAQEQLLFDGMTAIQLPPKVFDTLLLLVENSGRSLGKNEMMQRIWTDAFVEENNLAQNISILRKTFGGDAGFIETVPKRGYRFIAPVRVVETDEPQLIVHDRIRAKITVTESETGGAASFDLPQDKLSELFHQSLQPSAVRAALNRHKPETHYVQNGDVNIAYQTVGSGDIDIVFVMGWVSHLEYFWEEPHFASFLDRLASFSRLILFDKRGTGLSDRVPINELPTLEQRMEDVHAVMDAVNSKRAVLIGVSEGGPMCSLFAATYPERTTALVMIGSYAKRIRDDDYPWGVSPEDRDAFFELMQRDWGKPVGIEERAPSLANDEAFRDWWATYLRMGASPGAAVALTKMNAEIDVRNVLPSVRVPTLVVHRSGDQCLKVEEGRYVASRIPGSKYVELDGIDHLPFVGKQDEILDEIESFLTGVTHADEYDRVLATVMNVQFAAVASDDHEQAKEHIRRQLDLFKGREVSYNNGGMLATFDGPARAIRCATAIAETATRLGVPIKTGLHTGECDVADGKYGGFAVVLARKITDKAKPDNILVSRTVKDLVAGSGIVFEEFGIEALDGVEGEWRLFTVSG